MFIASLHCFLSSRIGRRFSLAPNNRYNINGGIEKDVALRFMMH
jgi:hypothetical protein